MTNNQRTRLKAYLSTISTYLKQGVDKLQQYGQTVKHKLQHKNHFIKLQTLSIANHKVKLTALVILITLVSAIAMIVFNKSNAPDNTSLAPSSQQTAFTPTQAEINITHLPAETLIFSDIQAQLLALHRAIENLQHQLDNNLDNPRESTSLQHLTEQQQLIQKSVQQLLTLIENPITQQNTQSLEISLQQLTNDMRQAHSELQQLREALLPEHYLSAEHLPFSVNAIEIWNEKTYVRLLDKTSTNQNQSESSEGENGNASGNRNKNENSSTKESLLRVGERQGQWQITHIDVDKQIVILRNQQHTYIRVTL